MNGWNFRKELLFFSSKLAKPCLFSGPVTAGKHVSNRLRYYWRSILWAGSTDKIDLKALTCLLFSSKGIHCYSLLLSLCGSKLKRVCLFLFLHIPEVLANKQQWKERSSSRTSVHRKHEDQCSGLNSEFSPEKPFIKYGTKDQSHWVSGEVWVTFLLGNNGNHLTMKYLLVWNMVHA